MEEKILFVLKNVLGLESATKRYPNRTVINGIPCAI